MAVGAGARRIGHGVMIGAEATRPGSPPLGLFDTLADRRIAVEINLSSNRTILGVSGPDHPLWDYISFGVPVVIGTDDEGIARSDVTNEWVQAVSKHRLAYPDLVRMARNSLQVQLSSRREPLGAGSSGRVSARLIMPRRAPRHKGGRSC